MKVERPKVKIDGNEFDLLSMEEFKIKIGQPDLSTPSIAYKLENDELDFTTIGHARYIIWNKKAENFTVLQRRPRKKEAIALSA